MLASSYNFGCPNIYFRPITLAFYTSQKRANNTWNTVVYQTFSKHSLILYSPGWQALCRSIHDVLFVFALKSTQCQKEKQQSDLTDVSGRVRQTRKYSEIHRSSRNFWTFAKNIRNTRKGTENSSRNFTLQIIGLIEIRYFLVVLGQTAMIQTKVLARLHVFLAFSGDFYCDFNRPCKLLAIPWRQFTRSISNRR